MKTFPIETEEACELCDEEVQIATQLVVMDRFEWFGSRLLVCDECKRRLFCGEIELEHNDYENCDQ